MEKLYGIPDTVRRISSPRANSSHEFIEGEFKEGETNHTFEFIRNIKSPCYLLKRIWTTSALGKQMWEYAYEKTENLCILYQDKSGMMVVGFIKRGSKKSLIGVIPVVDIKALRINEEGFEYPIHRQLKAMLRLRKSVAAFNDLDVPLLNVEIALQAAEQERKRLVSLQQGEIIKQIEKESEARKNKRYQHKQDRIKRINARPERNVFDVNGIVYHGIPVTESEWSSLEHNRFAILVTFYHEETREVGDPIKAFQIKKNGRLRMDRQVNGIAWKKPEKEFKNVIAASKNIIVDLAGSALHLPLINSDEISTWRKDIGNGIKVAIPLDDKKVQVLSLYDNRAETLGEASLR
jgi:hypothetical protein